MNKTYTEITPREALRILAETGEPLDGFAFRDHEDHPWDEYPLVAASVGARRYRFFTDDDAFAHCARVTTTSPIAPGHNPDKLTEEQVDVGEGWRLLTVEEQAHLRSVPVGCRVVDCGLARWRGVRWTLGNYGNAEGYTYRTKHPAGYYLPKPKTLVPWTFETIPCPPFLLREKKTKFGWVAAHWREDGIGLCNHVFVTWDRLSMEFEYSSQRSPPLVWLPCGTEVQS